MKSLPVVTYACEPGCGACCAFPIIEIDEIDIAREPKLKEACGKPYKPWSEGVDFNLKANLEEGEAENLGELVPGWSQGAMLAAGKNQPCKLLAADKMCSIYPTRPNCCVAFQAGSRLCHESREAHGKPRLLPITS